MEAKTYDPDTSPPPYGSDSYDIEVSHPLGNYEDFDEYRQEVDSFLRRLFRIGDPTSRAYSPLMFIDRKILMDESGETIVAIQFSLSSYGRDNSITFRDAVGDFCVRLLDKNSNPITGSLSGLEGFGFTPVSDIFKQSWTMAVYRHCSQRGVEYFTKFQARFEDLRIRQRRWAMPMNFLLLSEGKNFASAIGFILRCTGSPPINPWENVTSDSLTTASDAAEGCVRNFLRDVSSMSVVGRNKLFAIEIERYRSQTNYILGELTRLERDGFRVGEVTAFGNAVLSAVESASIIFTRNDEMTKVFLMLNKTSIGQEAACTAGAVAFLGGATSLTTPMGMGLAVAGALFSVSGAVFSDKRRQKAAALAGKHKELVDNIRSLWNIAWDLFILLSIMQYREQTTANAGASGHLDPDMQIWWGGHVNRGLGRGFDILILRTYLSEQRRHLEDNRRRFEELMADRDLIS